MVGSQRQRLLQGKTCETSAPTIPLPDCFTSGIKDIDIEALLRTAGLDPLSPEAEEVEDLLRNAGLDSPPCKGDTGGAQQSTEGERELAHRLSSIAHRGRNKKIGKGSNDVGEAKTKTLENQAPGGSAGLDEYPPHGEKQLRGRHSRHAHRMELY